MFVVLVANEEDKYRRVERGWLIGAIVPVFL